MTDLDELERLAREYEKARNAYDAFMALPDWPDHIGRRLDLLDAKDNAAFYLKLAASPDVILDLIARVRAAEGTVALLSDETRRKGLTSGSAMAAHLAVELEQMKPKP